jgi:hypothetical protein
MNSSSGTLWFEKSVSQPDVLKGTPSATSDPPPPTLQPLSAAAPIAATISTRFT